MINEEERVKIFVELYKHEDQLIWTKIKFILTFTSALIAAWAFTYDKENFLSLKIPVFLIPIIGLISSFLFFVTVYNSQGYLKNHASEWRKAMYPDGNLKKPLAGVSWLATSRITMAITLIVFIFWVLLLIHEVFLTNRSIG